MQLKSGSFKKEATLSIFDPPVPLPLMSHIAVSSKTPFPLCHSLKISNYDRFSIIHDCLQAFDIISN